jgi:hypothetical protein
LIGKTREQAKEEHLAEVAAQLESFDMYIDSDGDVEFVIDINKNNNNTIIDNTNHFDSLNFVILRRTDLFLDNTPLEIFDLRSTSHDFDVDKFSPTLINLAVKYYCRKNHQCPHCLSNLRCHQHNDSNCLCVFYDHYYNDPDVIDDIYFGPSYDVSPDPLCRQIAPIDSSNMNSSLLQIMIRIKDQLKYVYQHDVAVGC